MGEKILVWVFILFMVAVAVKAAAPDPVKEVDGLDLYFVEVNGVECITGSYYRTGAVLSCNWEGRK